jgi:NADPH-dependent glutamate synthase beta chain and related oxidoreductases
MTAELGFYDFNIPCLAACPVHTNAGAYVAAIADGDDRLAYLTARLPNPFASVCGRVCAAPCEDACRRGKIDRPIAIRALKRFVTERYGPEAGGASIWDLVDRPAATRRDKTVAIVGGGPAGLACAHDLLLQGYGVTLYEAADRLGGMMLLGIPEYRLPRDIIEGEIQGIVDLGLDVRLGTRLGRDMTLTELREQHDAVFLAIGATLGRDLDIPGHEADGVFRAVEFLLNLNQGFHVDVGERVVVIGGGNVAMDAARTALRAAAYREKIEVSPTPAMADGSGPGHAIDVARSAMRAGATQVTIVSLESRKEMPASEFEIEEAEAEDIRFVHRRGPRAILTDDRDRVLGLETVGVTRVFDEEGRFSPQFDESDVSRLEADTVILAIGQAIDLTALGEDGPEVSPRRTIATDPETLRTSLPDVWAGGDAAFGPRLLITAIAEGRKAAASIHAQLSPGDATAARRSGRMTIVEDFHRMLDRYDERDRLPVPALPTDRRIGLQEVELGYTEEEARAEASRCLRCFLDIQLDVDACVLCGLCSDVCPLDLISLVPSERVGGVPGGTALVLDETRCIRCALCIDRCPPKALSMGMWTGVGVPEEVPVTIGGVA